MIGILGGMGPQATVDASDKLIKHTDAQCDQEHIPTITVSIPDIADRTTAIQNNSDTPLSKMVEYIKILEKTPVTCVIIPCNTAHYWLPQLQRKTRLPIISMIDATVTSIKTDRACILGTTGTLETKLYQTACQKQGIKYTIPSAVLQKQIMQSIYAYKAGHIQQAKQQMKAVLQQLNAKKYVLACTELPLILADEPTEKFIDSTEQLVKAAIYWYQTKQQVA